MPEKPSEQSGHFGRFHALTRKGWLAVLTQRELALWAAYETCADPDGTAFPDRDSLARMLGHDTPSHVGRIRGRLEKLGLLKVVTPGNGRGHRCTVQMLLPPEAPTLKGAAYGTLYDEEKGAEDGTVSQDKGCRFDAEKGAVSEQKGCRFEHFHNKEDQTIDQTIDQTKGPASKSRGAAGHDRNAGAEQRPGKRARARKLSDEQRAAWDAFRHWWTFEGWAGANGGVAYEFADGRDGAAVKKILSSRFVGWDFARAKLVAEVFLAEPDEYLAKRGHVLHDLADRLNRFVPMAERRAKGSAAAAAPAVPSGRNGTHAPSWLERNDAEIQAGIELFNREYAREKD